MVSVRNPLIFSVSLLLSVVFLLIAINVKKSKYKNKKMGKLMNVRCDKDTDRCIMYVNYKVEQSNGWIADATVRGLTTKKHAKTLKIPSDYPFYYNKDEFDATLVKPRYRELRVILYTLCVVFALISIANIKLDDDKL